MKVKELITELLEYGLEDEIKISIHMPCSELEDPDIYHYKLEKGDLDTSSNFEELLFIVDCNDAVKQDY